nr:G-patch domain and KOW motifs-containing protein isoform X2 [Parasteatoda tepidariorum]
MDRNERTASPNVRQNVSFKFTKTSSSKSLSGNKLEEPVKPRDYVKSVDESEIKSTAPELKSQELVIPLIRKNNWRVPETSQPKDGEATLNELALKELLQETADKKADWNNRDTTMAIPLMMQNKVPEGFETDDKLDVSLRAQESTLEDYEKVPVEQFGLAMLRGMGWKEGMAIGARNKECVKPIEVKLRPKGLGLGADASVLKKNEKKAKEEKLELIKGAFVQIIQGPHKGHYGQVMGLDEETGRAMIKLSNEEAVKSLPEFFFNLVSKKEFDKESRIINRESYEKYKMKEEEENKEKQKYNSSDSRSNGREDQDSYEYESKKSKKHSKKRKHSRERSEENESSSKAKSKIWIRPQLKVRFIDEKYKKGKYFNKKHCCF